MTPIPYILCCGGVTRWPREIPFVSAPLHKNENRSVTTHFALTCWRQWWGLWTTHNTWQRPPGHRAFSPLLAQGPHLHPLKNIHARFPTHTQTPHICPSAVHALAQTDRPFTTSGVFSCASRHVVERPRPAPRRLLLYCMLGMVWDIHPRDGSPTH